MAEPARPSLRESVRSMPNVAWVLFAGSFVNRLGTFVLPFITLYLTTDRHYSAPQAGIAVAAYGVGGIAAQAAGGLIADRLGRRNAIAMSMFAASVLTVVLWRATSLAAIYPLMVGLGASAELYRPAAGALIADLLPSDQRVTAFTLYRLAVNIGWAVGLALGGFVIEHSITALFLGDAASSLAFGAISLAFLPHGTRTAKHEEAHLRTARRSILDDRGFLLFLAAVLITGTVYAQNASTFPLHLHTAGHRPSVFGLLQALNGLLIVVFELPVITWTQRHARTSMIALGQFLIGLGFFSLLLAERIPALLGMVVVWTLGEMIESPVSSTYAADRAPARARGRYQSAYGAMFGLAWMFGPVIGTTVFAWNEDALWVGCGVFGVIAAVLAVAAGRQPVPVHDEDVVAA